MLWKAFREIGIQGMHTCPMRIAGGIKGRSRHQSVDGWFDRIGYEIDPVFGSEDDYGLLVNVAAENDATIIDDIIPGHTGKGADFLLAAMNYRSYPGIYHMIEISPEDWNLLPEVPDGEDSVNLSPEAVAQLKDSNYIVGDLQRVLFQEDGIKDTNWSVTSKITGVDRQERRWVYLHCFKSGQPTMNWLDPSFAANRIIAGEIITSLGLGAKILRLDANSFLGVEANSSGINSRSSESLGKAWSEASREHPEFPWAHPLSVEVSGNIAMMVRKLGGFTFQELDLSIGAPKCFSEFGADLSYDFITRTAYFHALLTGNAEFLRIMLDQMHRLGVRPNSLIHALQNHDDITYALTHLSSHGKDLFYYDNMKLNGLELKNKIIKEMLEIISDSSHSPSSNNGICTTMAGLCAAAFRIKDPYKIGSQEKSQIKKAHLLAAMFNALQPGVFAFSGWDLVGALPLPKDSIEEFLKDGDNRWINRGSYDLMGTNPDATRSSFGVPKADAIYGNLPAQLKKRNSFASKLKEIIRIRRECRIHLSEQIAIVAGCSPGFISMIHELPGNKGIEITALNFGRDSIEEEININSIKDNTVKCPPGSEIINLFNNRFEGVVSQRGDIALKLDGLQGKALICRGSSRN